VGIFLGRHESGSILIQSMSTTLENARNYNVKDKDFGDIKKEYLFIYFNLRDELVFGNIEPGSKIGLIDEAIISGDGIIKTIKQAKDYVKSNTKVNNVKLDFPVAIAGLDMMVVDSDGYWKKDVVAKRMKKESYSNNVCPKVFCIATIEDCIEPVARKIGEKESKILRDYVNRQKTKAKTEYTR
jgi:hypothetical protein